jgi:hypothetical protein
MQLPTVFSVMNLHTSYFLLLHHLHHHLLLLQLDEFVSLYSVFHQLLFKNRSFHLFLGQLFFFCQWFIMRCCLSNRFICNLMRVCAHPPPRFSCQTSMPSTMFCTCIFPPYIWIPFAIPAVVKEISLMLLSNISYNYNLIFAGTILLYRDSFTFFTILLSTILIFQNNVNYLLLSSTDGTLESWVRIPLEAWMYAHVYVVDRNLMTGQSRSQGVISKL